MRVQPFWKPQTNPKPPSSDNIRYFQASIKATICAVLLAKGGIIQSTYPAFAVSYPPSEIDTVERVVDGDTLILSNNGRVRLIGINTPETVSPAQKQGAPPQCYGPEASEHTKEMLPSGTKVRLESDSEPVDRFGRKLAYVYRVEDGMFINSELVEQGYARAKTYGKNNRYESILKDNENQAKMWRRGLWGACTELKSGKTTPTPPIETITANNKHVKLPNPGDTKNCADFDSYKEAKDWYDKYFPLYGDVAKLDGDADGIPCESLIKQKIK